MIENETLSEVDSVETDVATHEAVVEAPETTPGMGIARLILKRSGAETEHVFEFGSPAIVGRFDPAVGPIDVDLGPLEEGVYVSRKHAKIFLDEGVWQVQDLGSSNGTFVLKNDFERVETAALSDGDELAFGNARFVFHTGAASSSEPDPEPAEDEADQDM